MIFSCHCRPLHRTGIVIAFLFRSHQYYLGVTVYHRGLATRLHELTATLFDLEETRMFGGLTYVTNGHTCSASWDDYLVNRVDNESAIKFVGNDPHARLFDLKDKAMKGRVMIATDTLGEEDDLRNYIDIAMLFTCTLPPKTAKQTPKNQP